MPPYCDVYLKPSSKTSPIQKFHGKVLKKEKVLQFFKNKNKIFFIIKVLIEFNSNLYQILVFNSDFLRVGDLVQVNYKRIVYYRKKKYFLVSLFKKIRKHYLKKIISSFRQKFLIPPTKL
mmetsp:Transcript_13751/g.28306  ORF Transcript_13751/g.28306 Transcript_13751/m.28306 type:complete len:120 (+) Transcript_13751:854-1213(+)